MKLAILGASGNTGLELVLQALERGHSVTAVVRNPSRLKQINHPKFKMQICNLLDPHDLTKKIVGSDVIISVLGSSAVSFYQESIKSIVDAMRNAKLTRLICVTSHFTKPDSHYPDSYREEILPMFGPTLDSMFRMETFLFRQDDVYFTIVRPPPFLNDNPLKECEIEIATDRYFFTEGLLEAELPRSHLAKFLLDDAEKNLFKISCGVAIALKQEREVKDEAENI